MATVMRMPAVAAGAADAVLQEWAVDENATFSAADSLAAVETDKAVVDLEAEADGVLLKQLVPAGSRVEVGAPIAVLGEPGEPVPDLAELLAGLDVTAGDAAGDTAGADGAGRDGARPDGVRQPEGVTATTPGSAAGGSGSGGRIFASPLARRLAAEAGLTLAEIDGSGPGGRIVRRDVEAAVTRAGKAPAAARPGPVRSAPAMAAPAAPERAQEPAPYIDIPHTRIRRAIAERLAESARTAPHFSLRATVRVDELLGLRAQLNGLGETRVSVTDLVVKAAARAHTLVPEMNVIWTPDAVRSFAAVDVGVAVATDDGLVTPVLRRVDELSITSVAARTRDLAERARAGRLRQHELEGGTLTVTNLGMYGTEEFTAVINPPQAAILAVGAARREPVATDDGPAVATVLRVTLSADHRPVDGAVAARWLAAFVQIMEAPVRILA